MQLSDIEALLRSHLIEGETMAEEPTNHKFYGDSMYVVTTAGLSVRVCVIEAEGVYALETEGALEVWRPGVDDADRTIEAVLGHARRNGAPEPPPDPEVVFADAIAYLRPLLQEGESLSTVKADGRRGQALIISTPVGSAAIIWEDGGFSYSSRNEPGYNHFADADASEDLLRLALNDARTADDPESWGRGNR